MKVCGKFINIQELFVEKSLNVEEFVRISVKS